MSFPFLSNDGDNQFILTNHGDRYILENEAPLVSYAQHDKGGHFAALEQPEQLWGDVEEFVAKVRKDESKL